MAQPNQQNRDENLGTELSEKTWIPLGLAITVVLGVAGGVVWLNMMLTSLDHKIDLAVRSIDLLNVELRDARERRVTQGQLREWAKLLQAQNKELNVPIPDGVAPR